MPSSSRTSTSLSLYGAEEAEEMGRREKRKGLPENSPEVDPKKTRIRKEEGAAEEPTDEEVEEFFVILRRMKEAAAYFGGGRRMLTESLRAVVELAADREAEEKEEMAAAEAAAAAVDVNTVEPGRKRREKGKGKEVVEENGLRLDLNISVPVESDGR